MAHGRVHHPVHVIRDLCVGSAKLYFRFTHWFGAQHGSVGRVFRPENFLRPPGGGSVGQVAPAQKFSPPFGRHGRSVGSFRPKILSRLSGSGSVGRVVPTSKLSTHPGHQSRSVGSFRPKILPRPSGAAESVRNCAFLSRSAVGTRTRDAPGTGDLLASLSLAPYLLAADAVPAPNAPRRGWRATRWHVFFRLFSAGPCLGTKLRCVPRARACIRGVARGRACLGTTTAGPWSKSVKPSQYHMVPHRRQRERLRDHTPIGSHGIVLRRPPLLRALMHNRPRVNVAHASGPINVLLGHGFQMATKYSHYSDFSGYCFCYSFSWECYSFSWEAQRHTFLFSLFQAQGRSGAALSGSAGPASVDGMGGSSSTLVCSRITGTRIMRLGVLFHVSWDLSDR